MSRDYRISDVLTPTASSVAFCLVGMALSLFFVVLPRLGGDALLGLLFGNDASQSLISSSKDSYGPMIDNLLSNDLLGRAVVFGVWVFIGLCVFILMSTVIGIIGSVEEESRELSYLHQDRESLVRTSLTHVAFRIGVAALWAGFITISLRYVLSYYAVSGFVALAGGKPLDWVFFVVATIVLGISLHVQVVFARLMLGRTRIWNS